MDKIKSITTELPASIQPTFAALIPHLTPNAAKIRSQYDKMETHAYGPDPQQEVDIYYPAESTDATPVLLYLFGGGFFSGNKQHQASPDLIFANFGGFFCSHGFITAVANYRLVQGPIGSGGTGKYPSGGEDIALALGFLKKHLGGTSGRDICLMGNSAGAVHVMTYLFEPRLREVEGLPKAAVLISPPCHQRSADPMRSKVNAVYYGSSEEIENQSPLMLMEKNGVVNETQIMGLVGSLEEASVDKSWADFQEAHAAKGGHLENYVMEGHNHISPIPALNGTEPEGSKWAEDVVSWLGKVGFSVR